MQQKSQKQAKNNDEIYIYEDAIKESVKYFNGEELAAKVFVSKYALRDLDNNLLEATPDQMHRRLAKEFARIEAGKFKNPLTEDEIFNLFDRFSQLIPQGSPLYGIGNPYQTVSISNCIHGETLVYTLEFGLIKMKDIKPGYHVLTHKSRFKKVLRHWSNGIQDTYTLCRTFGNKRPLIRTENEMGRYASLTPNHKVLTKSGLWETIENLKGKHNNHFATPTIKADKKPPEVIPLDNGRHIIVNEDFYWICGLYLAEGAIKKLDSSPSIYFTIHPDEQHIVDRVKKFAKEQLNNDIWVQSWKEYNFIQINIFDPAFASLINNIFNHGFDKKRIPQWVFGASTTEIESILDGFLTGDGTNYTSLEEDYNMFSIANPSLAYELGLLARNIGKTSRFNFLCKGKLIKHRTIAVTISNKEDNIIYVKSPVAVEVFDMEIEEDHSFVAGDLICHNCFVIEPPHDSYGGICKADEELSQISKRRGGVGIDLSNLRPTDAATNNSSKTSTGTASWMTRYSNSIREVGQGGRRGALMETISVHHPDIDIFSTIKNDNTKVTGANISVRLTDEFLNAVANKLEYEQRWPIEGEVKISCMVDACKVWDTIIHSAWFRAEPGILFWDNILKESIPDCYSKHGFKTTCTNPCSEICLSNYDSCRLMAIMLFCCVENPYTNKAKFNYRKLFDLAKISQRLMDDLVDLELECIDKILTKINNDPESDEIKQRERGLWIKIKEACVNGRRTGLGITGLGDTIAALGIKYGSEESIAVTDKIYKTLKFGSYTSSVEMAKELGPFPVWDWELEKDNPFLNRFEHEVLIWDETDTTYGAIYGRDILKDIKNYGRRNIANLTTAPTGSISILASLFLLNKYYHNVDAGIEPTLFIEAERKVKGNLKDDGFRVDSVDQSGDKWMHFTVYHSGVRAWMDVNGKTEVDASCPYVGATANDIDWIQRVKLQAAAQKHVDHAISSTINLPNTVTEQEVAKIYEAAWKYGLKGITVYRDGCRTGVITKKEETSVGERPKELICDIHHISVKGIKYFVLVGLVDDKPYEVFAGKNGILDKEIKQARIVKKRNSVYQLNSLDGNDVLLTPITQACSEDEEAITRLSSLCLRSGANIHLVVKQLEKVSGDMMSFARSVSRALKKYVPDNTPEGEPCPECKALLVRRDGCPVCKNCGYSRCV